MHRIIVAEYMVAEVTYHGFECGFVGKQIFQAKTIVVCWHCSGLNSQYNSRNFARNNFK